MNTSSSKEKAAKWIDAITADINDPSLSLEHCLRKTLVLAYELDNDKLKTWVKSELDSYEEDSELPSYRKAGFVVKGYTTPYLGSGRLVLKDIEHRGSRHAFFAGTLDGFPLLANIAALEAAAKGSENNTGGIVFNLHPSVCKDLEKSYPGWHIESAWVEIAALALKSMLSTIKTKLLLFLLDLNKELGNEGDYSIMNSPDKVNRLFDHTIGPIHAENVTIGNNYQNKGDHNNVMQGNQNTQQITSSEGLIEQVKNLTKQIDQLLTDTIDPNSKEDIALQLDAIKKQIGRETPSLSFVGKSLQMIESVLLNVASNVYQPTVLAAIQTLLPQLP